VASASTLRLVAQTSSTYRRARGVSNRGAPGCRGAFRPDVTGDHTVRNLSARQRDVMELIVRGLSNKEIASILNLAEGTVKIPHVAALVRKLVVH
jgi:DNA-binding NarL/FixJ family response regulator